MKLDGSGTPKSSLAEWCVRGAVWGVFVLPECRGRGLAGQLLDGLIERAQKLAGLRQLQLSVVTELETAVQKFRQAFAIMYDSHKYVCDKFEGGQPSLLMGEEAQKTAAEMIDTFKRNRLLVLGVPAKN